MDAAADWYERERVGLRDLFERAVDDVLTAIRHAPLGGTAWRSGPAKRWRIKRFPFQVVYLVASPDIVVVAVAHDKRRPGYWVTRVSG
jgi:plasmid stabilization system protein ParE